MIALHPPMHYLFSEEGSRALDYAAVGRTLFAFDFDGTLAPIVARPEQAHLLPGIGDALSRLAQTAPVAVISGRDRAALLQRLPPALAYVVGNHGNEGLPAGDAGEGAASGPAAARDICSGWLRQLADEHGLPHALPGSLIEDKGVSLSLHWRLAGDAEAAEARLRAAAAALRPAPRVIDGLFVLNVLPPQAQTKREALQALMDHSRCSTAIFVGDDITDELVFEDAPEHWLTVHVGAGEPSHARYFVNDPQEVHSLLMAILARREGPPLRAAGGG
ncbi:MAG: trehalose-phosphatase [Burkholderiales bacterium]|nr:trehalose-phosphatase [Burkholderiales bacterium]